MQFGYVSKNMIMLRNKLVTGEYFDYLYKTCFLDNNALVSTERNNVRDEILPLPYKYIAYCPEITYTYDAKNYYYSNLENSIFHEGKHTTINTYNTYTNPKELDITMSLELRGFHHKLFDFENKIVRVMDFGHDEIG